MRFLFVFSLLFLFAICYSQDTLLINKRGSLRNFNTVNKHQRNFKFEYPEVFNKNLHNIRKLFFHEFGDRSNVTYCKISLRVCVLESGKIYNIKVSESTINDSIFESKLIQSVFKWQFSKIEKKIDTSCVEFPFVFSK